VALALLAPWPSARLCIADAAYDSTGIRSVLLARGIVRVIPNNPTTLLGYLAEGPDAASCR